MRKFLLVATAATATLAGVLGPAIAQPPGRGYGGGQPQGQQQGPQVGQGGIPNGSYQASCRNIQLGAGTVTAECRDIHSRYIRSTLAYGQCRADIQSNPTGMLSCGAQQSVGGQVADNGDSRDNRDNRRDNGGAAAGFLAGALLGGALAGNQGGPPPPPPPPPPSYGDARYGDPRYDWRYQQGGYGYGRRQGEWVPIAERADWLNRQIDDLQRSGRIDFRDARDYRRKLDGITFQERDMQRYGRLGPRQRDDLDRRFNDLAEEIRHDARED